LFEGDAIAVGCVRIDGAVGEIVLFVHPASTVITISIKLGRNI
jgi:hypothetical protein